MQLQTIISAFTAQPQINGAEEYLQCAVLVPLVFLNNEYHLLFEKRSLRVRQKQEICFPGGKFDQKHDKCFRDTAVRETREELGIDQDKIRIIAELDIVVVPTGVMITPFLATIDIKSTDELRPNSDEVEKTLLVPLNFFLSNQATEHQVLVKVHPLLSQRRWRGENHAAREQTGPTAGIPHPLGQQQIQSILLLRRR
jgi:peroxisomal coenzyme A diphosphatase NUDT7